MANEPLTQEERAIVRARFSSAACNIQQFSVFWLPDRRRICARAVIASRPFRVPVGAILVGVYEWPFPSGDFLEDLDATLTELQRDEGGAGRMSATPRPLTAAAHTERFFNPPEFFSLPEREFLANKPMFHNHERETMSTPPDSSKLSRGDLVFSVCAAAGMLVGEFLRSPECKLGSDAAEHLEKLLVSGSAHLILRVDIPARVLHVSALLGGDQTVHLFDTIPAPDAPH